MERWETAGTPRQAQIHHQEVDDEMRFRVAWKSPHLLQEVPPRDVAQVREVIERLVSLAIDTLQKGQKATIVLERID